MVCIHIQSAAVHKPGKGIVGAFKPAGFKRTGLVGGLKFFIADKVVEWKKETHGRQVNGVAAVVHRDDIGAASRQRSCLERFFNILL